jgi:hypothetical protein
MDIIAAADLDDAAKRQSRRFHEALCGSFTLYRSIVSQYVMYSK